MGQRPHHATGKILKGGSQPTMPNDDELDPNSAANYRRVLGTVPTSVAIITTMAEGNPVGVSVGSFSSVSLDPPLVGFFIAETSTTWPRIEPTGGFCASILSSEHEELCRLFATKQADKFAGCTWSLSGSGRPIIEGAVAWIDCTIDSTHRAGDHRLVVGRIESMGLSGRDEPLIFLGGRYGRLTELGRDDHAYE